MVKKKRLVNLLNPPKKTKVVISEKAVEELKVLHDIDAVDAVNEITDELKENTEINGGLMFLDKVEFPIYIDNGKEDGEIGEKTTEKINPDLIDGDIEHPDLIAGDGWVFEKEEKPERTVDSLSKSDLKMFQRTGVMPK